MTPHSHGKARPGAPGGGFVPWGWEQEELEEVFQVFKGTREGGKPPLGFLNPSARFHLQPRRF